MWKKAILAVGAAGVLAIPTGVALAATDDRVDGVDRNRVTTLARDQARDQVRDQDQAMIRDRLRIHDPATCDGTGPKGAGGNGAGYGQGVMDGTGPIHTPPADGTGYGFGPGGR